MSNIRNSHLVSVGIPTYNNPDGLHHTLEYISSQTYNNLEIIISDNCSDNKKTEKVVKKFIKKDNRIKYYRQEENIGPTQNFRFVLEKANGEYFMWAADDDEWDINFIKELKDALDRHTHHGVAMSSISRVYDDGSLRDKILFIEENDLTYLGYIDLFKKMIKGEPVHIFIYGLFRTKLIKKLLERSFPNCISPDRVIMCELSLATHFFSVKEILHKRLQHRMSVPEHHKDNEVGRAFSQKAIFIRYYFVMLKFIMTSSIIPLKRKIRIIPIWAYSFCLYPSRYFKPKALKNSIYKFIILIIGRRRAKFLKSYFLEKFQN